MFLFQIEVEAGIYLQGTEAIVQGKIVPVIIIRPAKERGAYEIFAVIVNNACPYDKVYIEIFVPVFFFIFFFLYLGCLICDGRIERQARKAVACEHPVVGIAEVQADIGVFDMLYFHAGIHVFLDNCRKFGVIKIQVVCGCGKAGNE